MEGVLVSVIIPTYNRKDVLMRSVNSVLNQTHKSLEVIVVDDGSTDNTEELFRNNDDRIKYFKRENAGANAARNYGIKQSQGEIIAFNDSDDEWLPEKIDQQLNYMNDNNLDAVFCQMIVKRKKNDYLFPTNLKLNDDLKNSIFQYNYIGTPALIFQKAVLKEIKLFDERMPRLQDWDFAIRLCNNFKVGFLEKPLLNIYLGTNSITVNNECLENALDILYEKYSTEINSLPIKLREKVYLKLARFYIKAGSFNPAYEMINKVESCNKEKILTLIYSVYAKFKGRF